MNIGHYKPKIVASLTAAANGGVIGVQDLSEVARATPQAVLDGIEGLKDCFDAAVPFWIESPKQLIDVGLSGMDFTGARLPYPEVLLEYMAPNGGKFGVLLSEDGPDDDPYICMLVCFYREEESGHPAGWVVPSVGNTLLPQDLDGLRLSHDAESTDIPVRAFTWVAGADLQKLSDELIDDPLLLRNMIASTVVALGFLGLMSCENVAIDTVPASQKLNAKRIRRGKAPLPDYRVLKLQPGKQYKQGSGGLSARQRRSPRAHTRRGHYRHYRSCDRRVWIPATTVLGHGWVGKEYVI